MNLNCTTPAFKGNYAVVLNNSLRQSDIAKYKEATSEFVTQHRGRVHNSVYYLDGDPKGIMHVFSMPKALDRQFEKLSQETGFKAVHLDKVV